MPSGEQAELLPGDAEIEGVLGVSLRAVEGMDKSVRQVLGADTSAISTLRCLKLYLERLGSDFQNASELQRIAGWLLPAVLLGFGQPGILPCFSLNQRRKV